MLRIFDRGYPGSRTWAGEANHTVSRIYAYKIKNFCFEFAEYVSRLYIFTTVLKIKKYFFSYAKAIKKPRL